MSRRRKRQDRDTSDIPSRRLVPVDHLPVIRVSTAAADLKALQDRRRFSFDASKSPVAASGAPARVSMKPRSSGRVTLRTGRKVPFKSGIVNRGKWHETFSFAPRSRSVAVCVRRKERREVLFALSRTGRGARSRKVRNEWSDVQCR